MASDVKFDGDSVILEGTWTRVHTLDIMLDASGRRINQTGERRALVHDVNDRLTINYAGDYPNGVKVNGQTSIEHLYVVNKARIAGGIVTPSILIGAPASPPEVSAGGLPSGSTEWGLDLVAAITKLQDDVQKLTQRVEALEKA